MQLVADQIFGCIEHQMRRSMVADLMYLSKQSVLYRQKEICSKCPIGL
jgi:hypothetical protein